MLPGTALLFAALCLVGAGPAHAAAVPAETSSESGSGSSTSAKSALAAIRADESVGWVPPVPSKPVGTPYGEEGRWWTWKGYHTGDDYEASVGTEIHAAGTGTVTKAGWLGSAYGSGVVIDHGRGVETLYAHMSDVRIDRGEQVEMGDVVGKVGATGNVTGPHLHFEMRQNGEPFDPFEATHGGPQGDIVSLGCRAQILR